MAVVRKEFTFEAGHHLPLHDGKCRNPHGHSYKLEVFVGGEINGPANSTDTAKYGMVMDFGDLSEMVQQFVLSLLDHRYLNDLSWFSTAPSRFGASGPYSPTAENIARFCFDRLQEPSRGHVRGVRVWEGYKSYAEVFGDD